MHFRAMSFVRAVPMACLVTIIVASTGCSGSGPGPGSRSGPGSGSGGSGGSGSTGLESALSRVADTAGNRTMIAYDNTAALVRLAGKDPVSKNVFAGLRGWGVTGAGAMGTGERDAGFDLYGENYGISAGNLPQSLSLMAGGQSSARITGHLTGLGWKHSGGKLVAPSPLKAKSDAGVLALDMAQVLTDGSDAVFGGPRASLSLIGSPKGSTLASDPTIGTLAHCLGNVVAAAISSAGYLGGKNPAAVAAGVSQPASDTATPHAVVCVSWPSQAAASHFTTELRKALSGLSPATDKPYSAFLKHVTVTTVGGSHHVVEWQADTPRSAMIVFQMIEEIDLPALPDCSRLTPMQRPHITGCT